MNVKRAHIQWTAVAVLSCWGAALADITPVLEIDVVENGGFEDGRADDRPKLWTPRSDPPEGTRLVWDSSEPHSGRRCIGLTSTNEADRPWFWWEHRLRLEPGRTYRLEAWLRSDKLQRGATLLVSCRDV